MSITDTHGRLYLYKYKDIQLLYEGLLDFIQFYNYKRKHQSLAYLTPAQVYREKKKHT
jgi:putative transposase